MLIIAALSAYSCLMEFLQAFSPGRHPGLNGMLWSSAGAILGSLLIPLLRSRMR
jgi:VanZ family protein